MLKSKRNRPMVVILTADQKHHSLRREEYHTTQSDGKKNTKHKTIEIGGIKKSY